MSLFDRLKKKFASQETKLIRICSVTGNVEKMEKIWISNPETKIEKINLVYKNFDTISEFTKLILDDRSLLNVEP